MYFTSFQFLLKAIGVPFDDQSSHILAAQSDTNGSITWLRISAGRNVFAGEQ
jgi:hypothetical protein